MKIKYCLFFLNSLILQVIITTSLNTTDRKINIQQLSVKNQFDLNGGGTHSCAYHALKNGLYIF